MKPIFGYYDRVKGETTDRVVREDVSGEKTFDGNLSDVKDRYEIWGFIHPGDKGLPMR